MKKYKIHPITRKRLERFRKVRYAYWSFIVLIALYGLSLGSELLCNNQPLLVRYEGKTYFPFLRYYPENTFTGNGRMTRPSYKRINERSEFSDNGDNYMLFAPIPFGPRETLRPSDIETSKYVTVGFKAKPAAAILYLRNDNTVEKLRASQLDIQVRPNDDLSDLFSWSEGFSQALAARFRNQESPAFEEQTGTRYILKLAAYHVKTQPRRTVRVYLNESLLSLAPMKWKDDEWKAVNENWGAISQEQREQIERTAATAAAGTAQEIEMEINGTDYLVAFSTEQVVFPFRPCKGHYLGLDSSGRDVLTLILYGFRIAFSFGILLVLSAMVLGTLIGSVQGYYAGKVDLITQRLIEIWQAMPFLYILILIGSVFGRSFWMLLMLYGIFNWIGISYYMRAEFLKLRKMPFVEAARCMGVRPMKIMMKHMLPNALVPLVTFFPFSLVGAISVLAALDYLGFGLPAGTPSWGGLLAQAQEFRYAWWLILYPSLALFVVMLLGVFVGEGVRTAFDPRQYSRMDG